MDKKSRIEKCLEEAIHNYGSSYIYRERANKYQNLTRALTALGLIIPIMIGGIVTSELVELPGLLNMSLLIASILGLFQLIGSAVSLVYNWDGEYGYSLEALTQNRQLAEEFRSLALRPPDDDNEFLRKFELLMVKNGEQNIQDDKKKVSEKEKLKGRRAAYIKYEMPCPICKKIPIVMKKTDCVRCGKY